MKPRIIIRDTDWAALAHAYGSAADIPQQLTVLLGEDLDDMAEAVRELHMAVVHQGRVFSATPAVVRFLTQLLNEWDYEESLDEVITLVLYVLYEAGWAAQWEGRGLEDHDLEDDDLAAIRAVGDLGDEVSSTLLMCARRRWPHDTTALEVAVPWLLTPGAEGTRAIALDWIRGELTRSDLSRTERAVHVLALGDLGGDVRGFLECPDPAIRTCAALALLPEPHAHAVVAAALDDPEAANEWFDYTLFRFIYGVSDYLAEALNTT